MLCGSLIKIWNLANHMKKKRKKRNIRLLVFSFSSINLAYWCLGFHNVRVIKKLTKSWYNIGHHSKSIWVIMPNMILWYGKFFYDSEIMWTAKHLEQPSCTELTWLWVSFPCLFLISLYFYKNYVFISVQIPNEYLNLVRKELGI